MTWLQPTVVPVMIVRRAAVGDGILFSEHSPADTIPLPAPCTATQGRCRGCMHVDSIRITRDPQASYHPVIVSVGGGGPSGTSSPVGRGRSVDSDATWQRSIARTQMFAMGSRTRTRMFPVGSWIHVQGDSRWEPATVGNCRCGSQNTIQLRASAVEGRGPSTATTPCGK